MKKDYLYLAVILLLVLVAGCNACRLSKEKTAKEVLIRTVTKTDTAYLHDTVQSVSYVPKPYKAVIEKAGEKIIQREIKEIFKEVDTAAILKDYTAKVYYNDSFLTQYGKGFIIDTLQYNRIAGRSWKLDFKIPVVTNTITNTVKVKAKPKKIAIGIQAGYGYTLTGDLKPRPYIGAGITYSIIRF